MEIAYTIGHEKNYDILLLSGETHKLGRQLDESPPYPGGWVWRTALEAQTFIQNTTLGFEAAVYTLELVECWKTDVTPYPGEDGVHNLLIDARIVGKVHI